MKVKSIMLIVLGVLGIIFVCAFDTLAGKPVNDITGPRSVSAFFICGLAIIAGIRLFLKSSLNKGEEKR
ncbi:MAG: hypothetical protein KKC11_03420 [Candidatus Omnitrophica bacterium]|nr:hypothetical protein [Candidatus Omnitrophota bacterium]MBU0896013.1 hypothetical protein [Candidatus Omnitrophota bacterium]MBU1133562.1 hypothetical protein [Candidatus Omnitrophota bacterium]MBU1367259.1 hypothetical protein [Candidatus Omnitrophota bacterium]MBU1524027.1 hypothetical protein [Candidatus Omnitrophota bacterium]